MKNKNINGFCPTHEEPDPRPKEVIPEDEE